MKQQVEQALDLEPQFPTADSCADADESSCADAHRKAERIAQQVEQALDLEPQSLAAPPKSPRKGASSAAPSAPATASFDDDPHAALRPPPSGVIAGTAQAAVRRTLDADCHCGPWARLQALRQTLSQCQGRSRAFSPDELGQTAFHSLWSVLGCRLTARGRC